MNDEVIPMARIQHYGKRHRQCHCYATSLQGYMTDGIVLSQLKRKNNTANAERLASIAQALGADFRDRR